MNHNNKEYCEISNVEVLTRRKGYCSFLYKIVITTSDIPIISDNLNTLPGSFNIWKYLRFSWKPKNYQIGYINLSYNRIYKWSGKTPDHHICGMQTILLNDYQELENDDIFDEMLEMDDLSKDHYLFLSKYKKYLKDRDYIRLLVTRK